MCRASQDDKPRERLRDARFIQLLWRQCQHFYSELSQATQEDSDNNNNKLKAEV